LHTNTVTVRKEGPVSTESGSSGVDVWREVSKKAEEDPEFRQRLLADPRGVLAEEGHEIPPNVEVTIAERQPDAIHLVLPTPQVRESLEAHEVDASLIDEYNTYEF
jgi:hypothetical protein